jgi:hypothetical protein
MHKDENNDMAMVANGILAFLDELNQKLKLIKCFFGKHEPVRFTAKSCHPIPRKDDIDWIDYCKNCGKVFQIIYY